MRQAARNKLCAVIQALVMNDLLKADSLYSPTMDIARSLLLATTKNAPPAKAPLITDANPLLVLPEVCHQLLTIWISTGFRFCSLFSLPRKVAICNWAPIKCGRIEITTKTATTSAPWVFCMCQIREYAKCCPLCFFRKTRNGWTHERANLILKALKVQRHSFRRTLIIGFVLGSKHITGSPISAHYQAMIAAIFGWSCENKSIKDG